MPTKTFNVLFPVDISKRSVVAAQHVKIPSRSILCALHFEQDVTLDAQNHRILQTLQEIAATFQAKVAFLQVINGHAKESIGSITDLRTVPEIEPWVTQAQELFGSSVKIVRKPGDIVTELSDTAK